MTTQVQSAKTQQGFSLIELLVVVAIIGVLAAAGVVGYTSYLDNVKADTHKNNVVTLGKALQLTAVAANGGLAQPYDACKPTTVNGNGSLSQDQKAALMLNCVKAIADTNKFKSPYPIGDANPYVVSTGSASVQISAGTVSMTSVCGTNQQGRIVVHHLTTVSTRMPTELIACGWPQSGKDPEIVPGSFISIDFLN